MSGRQWFILGVGAMVSGAVSALAGIAGFWITWILTCAVFGVSVWAGVAKWK